MTCIWIRCVFVVASTSLCAAQSAATVFLDPEAYRCIVESEVPELGIFYGEMNVSPNGKPPENLQRLEWNAGPPTSVAIQKENIQIRADWSRDPTNASLYVEYNRIPTAHSVKVEVSVCGSESPRCKPTIHYSTDFEPTDGNVRTAFLWDALVPFGRASGRGVAYITVQDETGAMLREDKISVVMLLAVEQEIARIKAELEQQALDFKNRCDGPNG